MSLQLQAGPVQVAFDSAPICCLDCGCSLTSQFLRHPCIIAFHVAVVRQVNACGCLCGHLWHGFRTERLPI